MCVDYVPFKCYYLKQKKVSLQKCYRQDVGFKNFPLIPQLITILNQTELNAEK